MGGNDALCGRWTRFPPLSRSSPDQRLVIEPICSFPRKFFQRANVIVSTIYLTKFYFLSTTLTSGNIKK